MKKREDIAGQKFGKLTAIRFVAPSALRGDMWLYRCVCGKEKILPKYFVSYRLKKYGTTSFISCKCLRCRDYGTFFGVWVTMKSRCTNKNVDAYPHYGGEGVKICDSWKKFDNFREDMHASYLDHVKKYGRKDTLIDRIDNSGNYEKRNCRWFTMSEQQNNRSCARFITYKGKTLNASSWADLYGIKKQTFFNRLRLGWTFEQCVNIVPHERKHHIYNLITEKDLEQGLARKEQIKKLVAKKFTMAEIGKFYSVSRQRIHQIYNC